MGEGHAPKAIPGPWVRSWGVHGAKSSGPLNFTRRWPPEHLGFGLVPFLTQTSFTPSVDSWKILVILCILSRGPDSLYVCLPPRDEISFLLPTTSRVFTL